MAFYFLHVRGEYGLIEDPDGREYVDLDEARREATASAREVLAELVRSGTIINGQRFEITDRQGSICEIIYFRDVLNLP